jgi:protein phosphatase
MLRLSSTGVTHVGLVRTDNQDSAFHGPELVLVADGVGGAAAGEVASATTAYVVSATAMARREEDPTVVLSEAVRAAQDQLRRGVELDDARQGMASTLTAVLTNGELFALAHLGDSRGYVLRDDELILVTRDHTYVAHLVDQGRLSAVDAQHHPWRNVVTRTVNGDPLGHADVLPLALRPGDRILLASDGLTDLVSDDELAAALLRNPDDTAGEVLLALALDRGGRDNVTVVIARVVVGPRVDNVGTMLGAVRDPVNVVDLAAVRSERTA